MCSIGLGLGSTLEHLLGARIRDDGDKFIDTSTKEYINVLRSDYA